MSILIASLIIGILSLDTTIAFQVLLSQPIFSCAILGWVLGDPMLGLQIGLIMQLLWINIMPVGASTFPEGNVGSMLTCAIVILTNTPEHENLIFTVAFAAGIIISAVASQLTVMDRKVNDHILDLTLKAADEVDFKRIMQLDLAGGFLYALIIFVLMLISLSVTKLMLSVLMPALPVETEQLLQFVKPAVWSIGIGLTLHLIWNTQKNRA
ncbi:MAG: PTS sugar transporter subunit IIC [Calditrichota bacterium]